MAVGGSATSTAYAVDEVRPGDLHSLIEWLREANYDEADIQALQRALAEDGEAREEIRPSTQRWLGR